MLVKGMNIIVSVPREMHRKLRDILFSCGTDKETEAKSAKHYDGNVAEMWLLKLCQYFKILSREKCVWCASFFSSSFNEKLSPTSCKILVNVPDLSKTFEIFVGDILRRSFFHSYTRCARSVLARIYKIRLKFHAASFPLFFALYWGAHKGARKTCISSDFYGPSVYCAKS